MYKMHGA
jgi:hypothetical protein